MLNKLLFATVLCGLFIIILIPTQGFTNKNGAPSNRTGAPTRGGGEGSTCATSGCHESFQVNSGSGSVSITIPDRYEPGDTISITIRVEQSGASNFGFQATIRKSSDLARGLGTMLLTNETEFADAIAEHITHNASIQQANSAEWTFDWIAPEEDDAENIVVYAAGVAGNNNNNPMGDRVYTANATLPVQVSIDSELPSRSFELYQAYPNPFRSITTVSYSLEHAEPVRFALYDALGRLVKSLDQGMQTAGTHEILLSGDDLPAGTYYYQIHTPSNQKSHTLTRVR